MEGQRRVGRRGRGGMWRHAALLIAFARAPTPECMAACRFLRQWAAATGLQAPGCGDTAPPDTPTPAVQRPGAAFPSSPRCLWASPALLLRVWEATSPAFASTILLSSRPRYAGARTPPVAPHRAPSSLVGLWPRSVGPGLGRRPAADAGCVTSRRVKNGRKRAQGRKSAVPPVYDRKEQLRGRHSLRMPRRDPLAARLGLTTSRETPRRRSI